MQFVSEIKFDTQSTLLDLMEFWPLLLEQKIKLPWNEHTVAQEEF